MKSRRPRNFLELLRTGRWFADLPERIQDRLLDNAVIRRTATGECVMSHVEVRAGLHAVLDGAVRFASTSAAGREMLHMLVSPPSWFGALTQLDDLPCTWDVIADVPSELIHVPQPAVDALIADEPVFWKYLGQQVAHGLRLAMSAFETGAPVSPLVRLAWHLSMLIEGYGNHIHPRRAVELRQDQLAMMLRVSRQTTNQLLKELESRGIIKLTYGEIEVVDAAALRQIADA